MCTVSMIMDHKSDEWYRRYFKPLEPNPLYFPIPIYPIPTREEIDEFRRLLDRAREYDKKHGEPDCELEEKRKKLREMADMLGVKIDFV